MIKGIIFDWVDTLYERDSGIYAPVPGMLGALSKDYKMALITVADQGHQNRKQELFKSGLTGYFNPIIIDSTKTKEQFRTCISRMELTPEEVAVVGDRMAREIGIGNNLGCETYWIRAGYFENELPTKETGIPNIILSNVEELTDFL